MEKTGRSTKSISPLRMIKLFCLLFLGSIPVAGILLLFEASGDKPAGPAPAPPGMIKRPLGYISQSDIADMPVWQKQKIYYDLVAAEDRYAAEGAANPSLQAHTAVAKKHSIPLDTVEKVVREGLVTMWPKPTPLSPY